MRVKVLRTLRIPWTLHFTPRGSLTKSIYLHAYFGDIGGND